MSSPHLFTTRLRQYSFLAQRSLFCFMMTLLCTLLIFTCIAGAQSSDTSVTLASKTTAFKLASNTKKDAALIRSEAASKALQKLKEVSHSSAPPTLLHLKKRELHKNNHKNSSKSKLLTKDSLPKGIDFRKANLVHGRYVQQLPGGLRVVFSIDHRVQKKLDSMFKRYKMPYAGVVLIEPHSGKVLAMSSFVHKSYQKTKVPFALRSFAPSASVFKIITAAALIDKAKLRKDTRTCYHGGISKLTDVHIKGSLKYDRKCANLSDSIAWSINSLIAKLSYTHLSFKDLNSQVREFGFNTKIPFELFVEKSLASLPKDKLELARTAAGFWNTKLSALHSSIISAAVLHHGVMMQPSIVDSIENQDGLVLYSFQPKVWKRAMSKNAARQIKSMMKRTTQVGTARRYFKFSKFFPKMYSSGGKTGTLSRKKPSYLGYSLFSGFGINNSYKSDALAVGSVLCNAPLWHIKGAQAASDALRWGLDAMKTKRKNTH